MDRSRRLVIRTLLAATGLALGACGDSVGLGGAPTTTATEPLAAFTQFPDMPMPTSAEMDMERSLIFGGGESWVGRIVISSPANPNEVYDFYKDRMAGSGWREIASLRSAVSVLTFTRSHRVAIVQIQKRTIRGSEVMITVLPSGGPPDASPRSPSGSAAPLSPVQRVR